MPTHRLGSSVAVKVMELTAQITAAAVGPTGTIQNPEAVKNYIETVYDTLAKKYIEYFE